MFKVYMFLVSFASKIDVLGTLVLLAMLLFCVMFTAILDFGALISLVSGFFD